MGRLHDTARRLFHENSFKRNNPPLNIKINQRLQSFAALCRVICAIAMHDSSAVNKKELTP